MTAAEVETLLAGRRRELERLLRRFVHTDQDAEDAAALGAEALWRHRRRVHPARAAGWWYVVAKHEAWRIVRAREDVRHCDPHWLVTNRAARAHDYDELLDGKRDRICASRPRSAVAQEGSARPAMERR